MATAEILALLAKYLVIPFAGALIGAAIKGRIEDRRLFPLRKEREVYGEWHGQLNYFRRGSPPEKIVVRIYKKKIWQFSYWLNPKLVVGNILYDSDELEFKGGFYQQDHLVLDYRATERTVKQFGSVLLHLDASGRHLNGHFIGFYNELVAGKINLSKTKLIEAASPDATLTGLN